MCVGNGYGANGAVVTQKEISTLTLANFIPSRKSMRGSIANACFVRDAESASNTSGAILPRGTI